MIRNYIKTSLRNIIKNGSQTFLNVFGLSVGIGSAIIIFFIFRFDLSFDTYHNEPGQIYRLVKEEVINGDVSYDVGIPYPLRQDFKETFPEVEDLTFVDNNTVSGLVAIEHDGKRKKFQENTLDQAFVMPDFFKIFKYKFIAGDAERALVNNYSVVLAKSLATKYFGDYTNALGKVINIENHADLTVTGVVEDPPMNTDLPFKMLMSFDVAGEERIWDSWTATSTSVQAFVKLLPTADSNDFGEKIANYIQKNKEQGDPRTIQLKLQPLSDVHFNENYNTFSERIASDKEAYTLAIIGILLLVAACINFINLNTALAVKRSKEIGVRKVLGSGRWHLIFQFMYETGIVTFIAVVISLGMAELLSLNIQYIIGYDVPPTSYDWLFFIVLFTAFVAVTLLSGLYPSLVMRY